MSCTTYLIQNSFNLLFSINYRDYNRIKCESVLYYCLQKVLVKLPVEFDNSSICLFGAPSMNYSENKDTVKKLEVMNNNISNKKR